MIPNGIEILRTTKFFKTNYIGAALLESGVVIHMKSDGSAFGEDGKTYYTVSRDDENGDCEILGYSCDIEAPIDDTAELPFCMKKSKI